MAMPNNFRYPTVDWLRVETSHDVVSAATVLNVGIRCRDGWAHVLQINLSTEVARDEVWDDKARIIRRAHEHIAKQLAIAALEST